MAAPAPRLLPAKQPRLADSRTPEQRHWRSFKNPTIIKETGSVLHTHFSPAEPSTLVFCSSVKVHLYNANSRLYKPGKGLDRFKDTVLCAEFRKDGQLLVASDKSGAIRVIDPAVQSKFQTGLLRHWKPEETHGRFQVSRVKWQGATMFASAGDDKCVRLWDVMASTPLHTFAGHQDYVRALEAVPDTNLMLSGSLDGTARLWDSRVAGGEVATFRHGSESSGIVYSVLPLRGGTMFLTAGGSGVKVWDMTAGNEVPRKEMWNHQKEVTALCPNAEGSRVLAGGLDGHIKIYDTATWKVVHGIKYPAAILSVSLSSDEKHLAVGMSSSLLSLRSRMTAQSKAVTTLPSKRLHIQAFRDYQAITPEDEPVPSSHFKTDGKEYTFKEKKQKGLRDYDRAILGFRYGDALDMVLKKGDAILVQTILTELKHRSALFQALHNRSPETLKPILEWLRKFVSDPRYTPIIIDVTYHVLDIYGADLLEDKDVAYLIEGITRKVEKEIEKADTSQALIGLLEMLAK